ncbi:hypothetical protein H0H93_007874 [Arthromyces matolae]|nr:hypothetical protein H0H93_007874 [Arthromyces matolae]
MSESTSVARITVTPGTLAKLQRAKKRAEDAMQALREAGNLEAAEVLSEYYQSSMEGYNNIGVEDCQENPVFTGKQASKCDSEEDTQDPSTKAGVLFVTSESDKDEPVHNMITAAEGLIKTSVESVGAVLDAMQEPMVLYLAIMYQRLEMQKERFDKLQGRQASSNVLGLTAELYLRDAYKYFETVKKVVVRRFCKNLAFTRADR